jgi:uncharacterized protein with FMN-binding domain
MKRLAILAGATAAAIAVAVAIRPHSRPPAIHHPSRQPGPSGQSRTAARSGTPPAARHAYHSGMATGSLVHTDYGAVQVRVTISHGRIAAVAVLRLPHANRIDSELSRPAARVLERRVIAAQSAQVDMVSGATYTSEGYLRSLQSALDRLS